jgi:calcium-dependent protein kinase
LKRKSGPESDAWSIGVITYILLCGRRPFWEKTEAGIFNEVLKKKPDFREKPWPTISASAKDFVKKLLVKDAFARLTAAQALCTFSTVSCSCNLLGGMSKSDH